MTTTGTSAFIRLRAQESGMMGVTEQVDRLSDIVTIFNMILGATMHGIRLTQHNNLEKTVT